MKTERNISNKPKAGRNVKVKNSSKYFSLDVTKNNSPRIINKKAEAANKNIVGCQEIKKGEQNVLPGYTQTNK